MSAKFLSVALGLLLVIMVTEAAQLGRKGRNVVALDGYTYKLEIKKMTWKEATNYCVSEGGELAKMTGKLLYNSLRLLVSATQIGPYWIDGKGQLDPTNFSPTSNCTTNDLDLGEVSFQPPSQETCLTIYRNSTAAFSGYRSLLCTDYANGVFCGIPSTATC